MSTLRTFSEKERNYHEYQARQNFLREQNTIRLDLERMQKAVEQGQQALEQKGQELEQERMEKQAALQREQAAQAEIERLKAMLARKGD